MWKKKSIGGHQFVGANCLAKGISFFFLYSKVIEWMVISRF